MSISSVSNARFANTYASPGLNSNPADVAPGIQSGMAIQRDEFLQQAHSFSGNSAVAYQPTYECSQWDATGECTGYREKPPEVGGYEPTFECSQWDATGECTGYQEKPPEVGGYEPTFECSQWDATGECTGYQIFEPTLESNPDVPLLSAHIGQFETTPEILAPRGFEAQLNDRTTYATATLGDNKAALTQYSNQLTLTDLNFGDQATVGEGFQGIEDFRNSWSRSLEEAGPLGGTPGSMNWDYHYKLSGAGQAGNLVSVFESTSAYTGGARPNNNFELATYDAKGHRVELDDLLTGDQMSDVVDDVAAALVALKGPEGIDGYTFFSGENKEALRHEINQNFALQQEGDGVKIKVGLPSGIHALGDLMAQFEFAAPNDRHFQKAISQPPSGC